jgi:enterochelin esterase-like enzyme
MRVADAWPGDAAPDGPAINGSAPNDPATNGPAPDAPSTDGSAVIFRVSDPEHLLVGARLSQDVRIPGDRLGFHRSGDEWELLIARPPVHRMEYLLELAYPDGGTATVTDPANPHQAPGAFGPKSVLEFPNYTTPEWLTAPGVPSRSDSFDVPAPALNDGALNDGAPNDAAVPVRIWAPEDAPDDEPLPLLVAHDGPEYDSLASLTHYLAAGIEAGWLPRLRAALLAPGNRPGHRDDWYSANPRYARVLARAVLPALDARLAVTKRIGMGASLGALAMLHAHCRHPAAFDALFLQSGSFFSPRFDAHERRFGYYPRVVRFVRGLGASLPDRKIPVAATCGVIEENVDNNRLAIQTLRTRGYPAELHEVPDMHNYTAWRDGFQPYLTQLIRQVSE